MHSGGAVSITGLTILRSKRNWRSCARFFFSSRRRHTRCGRDWSSDVCSSDLVLERWADPRALRRLGRRRLTDVLVKASRGAWREPKADELLAAAEESLELWKDGGLDLDELAADIAAEVRVARSLSAEIATLEARIAPMFAAADRRPETPHDREATPPTRDGDDERDVGIVASLPGLDGILGAGILARFGDFDRFHSLAGIRSFTGLVPSIDQSGNSSGHGRPTKAGDPGLREALYLAADHLRRVDPHFAQRYHRLIVEED